MAEGFKKLTIRYTQNYEFKSHEFRFIEKNIQESKFRQK